MRKSSEQSLKEAIDKMLKTNHIDEKLKEVNLIDSWEKVVGSVISKHTTNVYIQRRKLIVKLDSAVLRQELSLNRTKIMEMLIAECGDNIIEQIEFR